MLDSIKESVDFNTPVHSQKDAKSNTEKKFSQFKTSATSISNNTVTHVPSTSMIKKLKPVGDVQTIKVDSSTYYMTGLKKALKSPEDQSSENYMNHLKHTAQSLLYIKRVEAPHDDDLLPKVVHLPPQHQKGRNLLIIRHENSDL